jgi:hypothetical protein
MDEWWRKLFYIPIVILSLPIVILLWPMGMMIGLRKLADPYNESEILVVLTVGGGLVLTISWWMALWFLGYWLGILGVKG